VAPEPEGSSLYSQVPATGPYPEPTESTPHLPANLPKIHSDPIYALVLQVVSFPPTSHQNLVHFTLFSHACSDDTLS
jgi:hypothetical protein